MEIIGAAALIAAGIVLAAVVYGRTHAARLAIPGHRSTSAAKLDAKLIEPTPTTAVPPREDGLTRRESELEHERLALADARHELEQALEEVAGMSAARAKQVLLKEVEDQARHEAARHVRQIEE